MNTSARKTTTPKTLPTRNPHYAAPIEVREPWASAFKAAGFVSLKDNTTPSIQALSRETGVHGSTITRLIEGRGVPQATTVETVAKALGVDFLTVAGWVNQDREIHEDWVPPVEAKFMDYSQRKLVERLIREMVKKG